MALLFTYQCSSVFCTIPEINGQSGHCQENLAATAAVIEHCFIIMPALMSDIDVVFLHLVNYPRKAPSNVRLVFHCDRRDLITSVLVILYTGSRLTVSSLIVGYKWIQNTSDLFRKVQHLSEPIFVLIRKLSLTFTSTSSS